MHTYPNDKTINKCSTTRNYRHAYTKTKFHTFKREDEKRLRMSEIEDYKPFQEVKKKVELYFQENERILKDTFSPKIAALLDFLPHESKAIVGESQ